MWEVAHRDAWQVFEAALQDEIETSYREHEKGRRPSDITVSLRGVSNVLNFQEMVKHGETPFARHKLVADW